MLIRDITFRLSVGSRGKNLHASNGKIYKAGNCQSDTIAKKGTRNDHRIVDQPSNDEGVFNPMTLRKHGIITPQLLLQTVCIVSVHQNVAVRTGLDQLLAGGLAESVGFFVVAHNSVFWFLY